MYMYQTWGKHFVKCLKHKFKHFQKGLKHKYKHMCFIKKVLEAQFQALAKGLKHKHKHFLSEYIFPSFSYRNRMNAKSFIKFYCKYLLLHVMNISLKNVVSASRHLSGLNTFPAMLNTLSTIHIDYQFYDLKYIKHFKPLCLKVFIMCLKALTL